MKKLKKTKQGRFKTVLMTPLTASKFLATLPGQSLKLVKPLPAMLVKPFSFLANKVDTNFMVVFMVAAVAVVGFWMLFGNASNDSTGALSVYSLDCDGAWQWVADEWGTHRVCMPAVVESGAGKREATGELDWKDRAPK